MRSLLKLYYDDPDRWSMSFQMAMLHRRWAMQMLAAAECCSPYYEGVVLDRSLWGDMVFARALTQAGKIHPKEWEIYQMAVRNMALVLFPPTLLVFLDVTPETALQRIKKRDRPQEKDITLEYLQTIHEGYHQLLREAKTAFYPWSHAMEVLHIPWDPDTVSDQAWEMVAKTIQGACRRAR